MRSSTCVALFAGAAIAQDSATIFNLFQFDSTLTVLGSDASATTYQKSCPSDNAGISVIPSDLLNTEDPFTPDSTPMPTPAPRMRRQDDAPNDDYSLCEPYTIIQGPETYEMHLTDPTPGAWTVDIACSWQGAMTTADLTCDATNRGIYPGLSTTETKSVLSASELQDMAAYQVVALVTASGASSSGSPSATQTSGSPSGSQTSASTGSGTGATSPSRSGSGTAATPSTGLAPAGSIPKAMAMVGGAVGIFAAAMAL